MIFSVAKVRFVKGRNPAFYDYICGMSRIVAIDFGLRRTGIAISDPLGMIANGLETVDSRVLMATLEALVIESGCKEIVIGEPKRLNGRPSDIEENIQLFIKALIEKIPTIEVRRMDERYTSKIASQSMFMMGATKKQKQDKGNLDKISATLILQEYLNTKQG
jgi:putative holliday junction resolvase